MTIDATGDLGVRRYRVTHRTEYRYGMAMTDGYTVAHLLPRPTVLQEVEEAELRVEPEPAELDEHLDVFGNRVCQFGVHRPHESLVVESRSVVRVTPHIGLGEGDPWEEVAARIESSTGDAALTVTPFRSRSQFVDHAAVAAPLGELIAAVVQPGRGVISLARDLCHLIYSEFAFDPTSTDLSTPLADVLRQRRGVCQDFAHLASGCLRSLGLAARYVSGYIETDPPPGQPRLVGADASHAWCSVWTPSDGWVDFDPTNDHLPVVRHVTVGWGRDYADISPVRGVVIGPSSGQSLEVSVDVQAI